MNALPSVIERERKALREVSDFIHDHPELGYKEFQAVALLKKFLSDRGFAIRENIGGVETAFMGYFASPGAGDDVPLFGFIGEYDALAGIGHGCGHNLIATSALAAILAAREMLEKSGIPFRLCYLGTPAEETLGGKVKMVEGGAFKGVAASLEAHPLHKTIPDPGGLSVARCTVAFHGRSAHAAICPEKGLNALNAICEFILSIRDWQPALGERERVHGIITKGGDAPNIIPEYTEAFYYLRAPNEKDIAPLKAHFIELAEKAAGNAGCTVEIKWVSAYKGMVFNRALNAEFLPVWKDLTGEDIPMTDGTEGRGSSDTGDVSYLMPCAQYHFGITCGAPTPLHTADFREAAASDAAFEQCLRVGASMAIVSEKYFRDPAFRAQVENDWHNALKNS